jgi:RluA family pseudouridine synthase
MIKMIFQNEDWIAVDKPSGLSVHNQEDPENLLDCVLKDYQLAKLFPVHRLDKETSGVQLLALNETAAAHLAKQFQNRTLKKFYQGVIAGNLAPEAGQWNWPLTDKGEGWKNPAGLAQDRVPCETKFQTFKKSSYFSWVQFEITTGRQHQIRKHCAISGHALIGDPRYGNPKYNQKIAKLYHFDRMALHCQKLILENGFEVFSEAPFEFHQLFPNEGPA